MSSPTLQRTSNVPGSPETTPKISSAWADVNPPTTNWDDLELRLIDDAPSSPTSPPPPSPVPEFWTLAKVIHIKSPHNGKGGSITMVEHESGNLIKCSPQCFSYPTEDCPNGIFININEIPLAVGDFTEICVSPLPPKNWDPQKGGKDISLWGLECFPERDALSKNGLFFQTDRSLKIAFNANAKILSSGKFSLLHHLQRTNGNEDTPLDGVAFCPPCHSKPLWKPHGILKNSLFIPFISKNKQGKYSHFILLKPGSYSPPEPRSSNVLSLQRR